MTTRQKQLLHFDSIYGTYNTITNASSGVTSSPYACSFSIPRPIRKVKAISLKCAEIPVTFANIRKGSTDTLTFKLAGTTYSAVLAEKLYTSIAQLILDLNIATTSLGIGATTPIMSLSVSTTSPYRVAYTSTAASFSIVDTNLSRYILGLRSTDVFSGNWLTAGANYNLAIDNYISLYIPSISSASGNVNGLPSTFKIPLNASNNSIFYLLEGSSYVQQVDVTDPNFVLGQISVAIKDRFGWDINPQGGDFSFTLGIEYEL